MAEAGQMAERGDEPGAVIRQHRVGARAWNVPVEQHRRPERRDPVGEPRCALVRDRDDQPVQPPLAQGGDQLLLVAGVVRGVGDHQRESPRAQGKVRSPRDRCEERVGDVADDEADGAGRARPHAARRHVGPVPEGRARRVHAVAHLRSNERLAVERTGDGRDRDSGFAGDIAEGGALQFGTHPGNVLRERLRRYASRPLASTRVTESPPMAPSRLEDHRLRRARRDDGRGV